jgi:hypothetical protein
MKKIHDAQPDPEKNIRSFLGDAPIANMCIDCENCIVKKALKEVNNQECKLIKNTINCLIARKRVGKILNTSEDEEEEGEDTDMLRAEKESLLKYLNSTEDMHDREDSEDEKEEDDD